MRIRRCFFVFTAVFAMALVEGCAIITAPSDPLPSVPEAAATMAPYFLLNGRISVRASDKVDSGQIRWHRSAIEERVGLYSPLGSQVAELLSDKRALVVTLQQGKDTIAASSVSELTQSLLGVPLDLDRVAEWTQGYRLRENEVTEVMLANGDQWNVTAERYVVSGNHRYASRVIAIKGDIVVRLVIDEWMPQ